MNIVYFIIFKWNIELHDYFYQYCFVHINAVRIAFQNTEFEEILPEERNADGINVDKTILIKIVM
jgi:hypothetical protein